MRVDKETDYGVGLVAQVPGAGHSERGTDLGNQAAFEYLDLLVGRQGLTEGVIYSGRAGHVLYCARWSGMSLRV